MDDVTLLAMAPAGDVLVYRDRSGRVWVHPPLGAGRPEVVDAEDAADAIMRHGFDRIDRSFASWDELEAFVEERVSRLPPVPQIDPDSLDAVDVEEMLGVARRWAMGGDGVRARKLSVRLLTVPVVAQSAELKNALVAFLEDLEKPMPRYRSPVRTPRQEQVRRRWDETHEPIAA